MDGVGFIILMDGRDAGKREREGRVYRSYRNPVDIFLQRLRWRFKYVHFNAV